MIFRFVTFLPFIAPFWLSVMHLMSSDSPVNTATCIITSGIPSLLIASFHFLFATTSIIIQVLKIHSLGMTGYVTYIELLTDIQDFDKIKYPNKLIAHLLFKCEKVRLKFTKGNIGNITYMHMYVCMYY